MNNYIPFNQPQSFQPYQSTQFFPQPQGNVYMIGNASEVATLPINAGLTAAISFRDSVMYIKTILNGAPITMGYKLIPLDNSIEAQPQTQSQSQPIPQAQFPLQSQMQPQPLSQQLSPDPTPKPETALQDEKIIAAIEDYENRISALEDLLTGKGGRSYGSKFKPNATNDAT